jgi:PAS domain S-box-containing protein
MNTLLCDDEAARLESLRQYQILDTEPEQAFDDLAKLAALLCGTPIALINLIDAKRQWFKAKVGLDITEVPRDMGLCPACLEQGDVLIVPDTWIDQRFAKNPVVTGYPHVRFYAGVPLIISGGHAIGTLCVVDNVPRQLSAEQVEGLRALSRQIVRQLDIRLGLQELARITKERQKAVVALQQSDSTLRSFFDSAPMMMGIVELVDNDILHIADNIATAKFFGLTPETMRNSRASEMGVPQNHIQQWIDLYRQAERTQKPVRCEYPHTTAEGTRWLRATVTTISGKYTRPRFAYWVEETTQRKQTEEELAWQEALLRSMTGVSPLAFYVVDNRTDEILYFNDRFTRIWGIEHLKERMVLGELKNQDIIPDCMKLIANPQPFVESCKPLQSEENRFIVEDEIQLSDGRIIRRFSTQVRDEDDNYFGRLYLFEDITARERAEHIIREQAALLNVTSDAMFVRDLDDKIVFWNKSAEVLYGWQAAEVRGKNTREILYPQTASELREIYSQVLETGSWQGELEKVTKSGKQIIVESRWTLVRNQEGKPKSILTVDTDITEKKQLETQFLRAQRMESIGTLASGIAHDLNNVLAPILMSVQLLKSKNYDDKTQQMLTIVETNAKRGANLVKQVLSFARGMEGDRSVLQARHLIYEMKQIVKETFPKSIEITTDIPMNLWHVAGDATQLHQVLMNLCVNARDAMPDGGNLRISAENVLIDENYARMHINARKGAYIAIAVADNGMGIKNEILDRIFDPFFTTKDLGKGTGLGLSTVMGIVKSHDGFISVSSTLNKGTEFKVYLPAVKSKESQQIEDFDLPSGNGELILVVDDEASIREITKTTLENNNYRVITATDGIDAVALYAQQKHEISAVIIDMMMPQMDGATAIHILHKMNPQIKMITVSGLTPSEQIAETIDSKIKAFLPKPYTAQELLKTLMGVISNR